MPYFPRLTCTPPINSPHPCMLPKSLFCPCGFFRPVVTYLLPLYIIIISLTEPASIKANNSFPTTVNCMESPRFRYWPVTVSITKITPLCPRWFCFPFMLVVKFWNILRANVAIALSVPYFLKQLDDQYSIIVLQLRRKFVFVHVSIRSLIATPRLYFFYP